MSKFMLQKINSKFLLYHLYALSGKCLQENLVMRLIGMSTTDIKIINKTNILNSGMWC